MIILEGNKIKKIYGGDKNTKATQALDGVDIKIYEGEFVAIMGPSGSGKTTLLNILSGLRKPTEGTVEFKGENIFLNNIDNFTKLRRQKMGFVFQDFNLLDSLTIKENIMLPMILEKKSLEHMERLVKDTIEIVDINSIKDKYPYNVSGGEQQRAAIARALVNNPDIIFADEPTGNLDSKSSKIVMKCFQEINEKRHSTILMVTHDVFAASFCKRVIFIKDGKVHSEIIKKGERRDFLNEILDCVAVLGGGYSDF